MNQFNIPIHQPYDFKTILAFLKRHKAFGIEDVSDECYTRYVQRDKNYAIIKVKMVQNEDALEVSLDGFASDEEEGVIENIKHFFDTQHNPKSLPKLTGVRVIGCYEPFEIAVSIILGQLILVKQATKKFAQLIEEFGTPIKDAIYRFPTPKELSDAKLENLSITKTKSGAIRSLSIMCYDDEIFLENDFDRAREKLLSIKGIGPWTTEMIMMRCYKDKDAFAKNDLFIQKAIKKNLIDEKLWSSNRAYLTHYIWNKGVQK